MNLNNTLTSAFVAVALSVATLPANAQDRRNEDRRREGQRATASQPAQSRPRAPQAVERRAPREAGPQARQAAPPRDSAPSQQARSPRAIERQAPREARPQARQFEPQPSSPAPRAYDNRQYQPRAVPRTNDRGSYQSPSYSGGDRGGSVQPRGGSVQPRGGYVQPRDSYVQPRGGYVQPRGGYVQPRGSYGQYGSGSNYSGRYSRPSNYVRYQPRYFARSYYSFRPRLRFEFGLWLGYSVPYPYSYLGSYRPRVWGYYPDGSYSVSIYGGVSFDIQPGDADLYVDGEYVGPIGDFTPYGEPLTLTPGVHRIDVQRDGFQPMSWDVTVVPGQVIPYRGAMIQY